MKTSGGTVIEMKNMNSSGDIRFKDHLNIEVLIIPKKLVNRAGIVDNGEVILPQFPCVGIEWL